MNPGRTPESISCGRWLCPTCGESYPSAEEAWECDRRDRQQLVLNEAQERQIRIATGDSR